MVDRKNDMSAQELIAAWQAWDIRPGSEKEAKMHLKTINEYAENLGLDPLLFRRELGRQRRMGISYEDCVVEAEKC